MFGEEKTGQEDARERDPEQLPARAPGGGNPPAENPAWPRRARRGHVPLQRIKPTAEQLLEQLGQNFEREYQKNSVQAWEHLLLSLMRDICIMAKSDLVVQIRDLITIARDVEDHVRKGQTLITKGPDGERRLPMDQIGAQWRQELQSTDSAATGKPTPKKTNSRLKAESASKSTTSSASASNSEKTSSETNGSAP